MYYCNPLIIIYLFHFSAKQLMCVCILLNIQVANFSTGKLSTSGNQLPQWWLMAFWLCVSNILWTNHIVFLSCDWAALASDTTHWLQRLRVDKFAGTLRVIGIPIGNATQNTKFPHDIPFCPAAADFTRAVWTSPKLVYSLFVRDHI